ncbi:MerR family transcriptional regulator [Clostridium oceanicum]|uniref:MerR family transcriptional regulator n=1 Tax=Clostridium oceanicum TaxID=1543 RepID=A0ABP3UPR1_9CLOT
MFRIGEFSKLNKISIKTLRHYDEIGLFKPAKVDYFTGYRYYSSTQIKKLNKIVALKSMGFSLKDIKKIVNDKLSIEIITQMLVKKQEEIKSNIKKENDKFSKVKFLLERIKREDDKYMLNYDVVIKKGESLKVASIRRTILNYSAQHDLWVELMGYLNESEIKKGKISMAINYDKDYKEKDVDVEICQSIIGDLKESENIKTRNIKSIDKMACTIHKGKYEDLCYAYEALQKWIEANNYKISGNHREIYIKGERFTKNPEEYITEVQIPVEKNN